MTYTTPLTAVALCASLSMADAAPGYRTDTLKVDHRAVSLDLHIWYPTDTTTPITTIGKNAVFKGSDIRADAPLTSGTHPLVVLSHGSGGNAANLSWIAAHLADRGMIVIAPNHPGTTSRDSHPDQTVKIWERPADLSAIIDYASETFDVSGIGAMGFSLGGHTALGIAGARVLKQDYIAYCDEFPDLIDCGWLQAGGVDFTQIDQPRYEQSNHDPRISVAVSIDPAIAHAYDSASLAEIDMPIQLISMGTTGNIPAGIDASYIKDRFTDAEHHFIDQATHFSFLGECTMMGKAIIMAAGEDPICSETGNRKRADIHAQLQATIGDFLHSHLLD